MTIPVGKNDIFNSLIPGNMYINPQRYNFPTHHHHIWHTRLSQIMSSFLYLVNRKPFKSYDKHFKKVPFVLKIFIYFYFHLPHFFLLPTVAGGFDLNIKPYSLWCHNMSRHEFKNMYYWKPQKAIKVWYWNLKVYWKFMQKICIRR